MAGYYTFGIGQPNIVSPDSPPSPDYTPVYDYSGTAMNLDETLLGYIVKTSSGSAITLTILSDANGLFPTAITNMQVIAFCQYGAGAITIAAGSGVTLRGSAPSVSQYGIFGIMRIGANEWTYL